MHTNNKIIISLMGKLSFILILVLPILLYLVPIEWLNKQHTICLFKNIFGIDCYGCGITRAVFSSLHLKFETAFAYNKMVVIVFPLLIYIWIKTTRSFYKKANPKSVCSKTA